MFEAALSGGLLSSGHKLTYPPSQGRTVHPINHAVSHLRLLLVTGVARRESRTG